MTVDSQKAKPVTKVVNSESLKDRYGLVVPSALPLLDEEEILLLRVLGRLEMMTVAQIHQLIFPTLTNRGVQRHLDRLLADELVWRAQSRTVAVNHAAQHEKVPRRGAFVYGLSDDAKALLETLDVEHDPLTRERLVSRDPRGRKPDTRTMSHDIQVSWFCTNVLLAASRNRYCRQLYVQTEFYSEKRQRIDALIMLRLSPDHPRDASEVGGIPFFDGTARRPGEIDIRLALEIDKGSEELKVLLEKIEKYRDLTQLGVYDQTIGGPLLMVFVVQTPRRAGQLARQFKDLWPSGWGVVATPQSANNLKAGVLWGRYKSLASGESFDLLTHLVPNATGQMQFFSAISCEEWIDGEVTAIQQERTAVQVAGQLGGLARQARRRERKPVSAR
jgi:hypothetical protein